MKGFKLLNILWGLVVLGTIFGAGYFCCLDRMSDLLAKKEEELKEVRRQEVVRHMIMDYRGSATDKIIYETTIKQDDPVLMAEIEVIESSMKTTAISPMNCRGLMGLSPDKLADWTNPKKNIEVGSQYFDEQIDKYGEIDIAIGAYNAGPGNVDKYHGIPPFKETRRYIAERYRLDEQYGVGDLH